MGIDIFSIKPNVVTRDLSGKSFLIYGERKSGSVVFCHPLSQDNWRNCGIKREDLIYNYVNSNRSLLLKW